MKTLYESLLDADFDISDDQVTYNIWEILPTKADMRVESAHHKAFGYSAYDNIDIMVDGLSRENIDKVLGRIAWWGGGEYELLDPKDEIIKRFKDWLAEKATDIGKFIIKSDELDVKINLCQYKEYTGWRCGIKAVLGEHVFFEVYFTEAPRRRGRPIRMNAK